MDFRILVPLAGAATLAYACGPWTRASSENPVTHSQVATGKPLGSTLQVRVGDEIDLALSVTNNTKKSMELRFPTGRTHDFYVYDASGKEVWRWSRGRMFTSVLQTRLVRSQETTTFHNTLKRILPKGQYTAVAVLRSSDHPVESRVAFALQ